MNLRPEVAIICLYMKLSFVVPAHNEEAGIESCLNSIFEEIKNSGVEAEVIVINNASSDRTHEVALSCGAKVVDENRKGIVWARQRGLEESCGELVANIDADNHLPAGWIKNVLERFENDKEMVCYSGPFIYRDISPIGLIITKVFYTIGLGLVKIFKIFGADGGIVQGGNFVFRREVMLGAGGYDTSIKFYGEDTAVAMRLSPFGKIVFSSDLPISSSGRRMIEEGILITGFKYAVNFVWISLFKRPFNFRAQDIRHHNR